MFTKYACCVKCDEVYPLDDCVERIGSRKTSSICSHISFPNHPRGVDRRPCGAVLMKEVQMGSELFFYPFKTFCYKSIIESVRELCARSGFLQKCESWRNRVIEDSVFMDIYDGQVWKDFMAPGGLNFFVDPHNLGLMLNVDWFQPYEHTQYSVGVIYLVVVNLPRSERFLLHNAIICGIIPGPSEPKHTINSFMRRMVKELQVLWKGVFFNLPTAPLPIRVRAALLCVAADIPASRKVCGFTGHNSSRGCSKCLRHFDIVVGQPTDWWLRQKNQGATNKQRKW